MKKRGFTLIELLAVIVILGLIALVTVTIISSVSKSYKNSLYQNQINNIESAARVWASDNMLLLPTDSSSEGSTCEYGNINNCSKSYNKLIIKLSDLQNGGYIDKNLKNVKTKEAFDDLEIIITKSGKKIEYEVLDQTYFAYEVGDEIVVKVNDSESVNFYVIEASNEKSKYVTAILVEPLQNDIFTWCSACATNASGPTDIYETLNNLGWNNVSERRLITSDEFNNVKEIIKNDEDSSWIGGNYWTSSVEGSTSAYYVNSTSELVTDEISNHHQVRPVIKISKSHVKLK